MERVVATDNMWAALRRVEKNKGAAGVDGLKIADLRPYLRLKWPGTWLASRIGGSHRGAWYSSGSLMNSALGAAYWQVQGLISLSSTYRELRQPC